MVNPGAFQGARKAFLVGEKEAYSQAVDDGYVAEAVAKIQRRYFKRFPIDLPDDVEPTPEELAAIDDDAVGPEAEEPDEGKLTKEEYEQAMVVVAERQRQISFRRSQIKRWLAYQYMKDHDVDTRSSGAHNPYRALLCKLTGQSLTRPRSKTPANVWRKTQRAAIEARVKVVAAEQGTPKAGLAALRDKIARDMFDALPEAERCEWKVIAQDESRAAQKQWEEEVKNPPSIAPEDRQRCILGLVRFMQPILNMVCEATGWKASFIAGGPEPAHGGKLNIISVHAGKTAGPIPLDFGTIERDGYKKNFLPMYGRFLKKCYSVEECHARALKTADTISLAGAEIESEGGILSPVDDPSPVPVSAIVSKRSQALLELRHAPSAKRPSKVSTTIAPPPVPVPKPLVEKPSPNPPATHSERRHRPAQVPDDSDLDPSIDSLPCPIMTAYVLALEEAGVSQSPAPPGNSDPPRTPPPRALSLPPSPPQSPVPSHAPSPPQTPAPSHAPPTPTLSRSPSPLLPARLTRPPSPAQSPTPSRPFTPRLLPPYRPPSPPASAETSEVESSTPATTLSSNESLPACETQSAGESNSTANSGSQASSISHAPRRSKRRRADSHATAEVQPSKRVQSTKSSKASQDNTPADPPSDNRPAPAPIVPHSGAPDWFQTIVAMLQGRGLDANPRWMDLVRIWSEFEASEGYDGATKLSSRSRPEVISAWLHRKRATTFQPHIDLRRYPKTYMDWWTSLQHGLVDLIATGVESIWEEGGI